MHRVAVAAPTAGTYPYARDRGTTGRTVASPAPYCLAAAVLGDQLARGGVVHARNDAAARPRYDARIAHARRTLAVHRISTETTRCRACQRACPCDAANEAANTLVGSGWPVVDTEPDTGPDAASGADGGTGAPRGRWAAVLSWLRERLSVDQDW